MLKFVRTEYLQFSTALVATATVQKSGLFDINGTSVTVSQCPAACSMSYSESLAEY